MTVAAPEEDGNRRSAAATYEQLGERCARIALKLGKERLIDACVPASFGGLALGSRRDQIDVRAVCLLRETLGWASALSEFVLAMQGLGSFPIVVAGSDALRKELLPPVLRGESLAAFALTEPEAGSDVGALRSTAERRGDEYVLNGRKTFISNAGIAGHYVVFAKTDPAAGNRGITAFVVKSTDPGFSFEGPQMLVTEHPVGTVRFDNLVIPASRRLGREGDGFKLAMRTLDTFRTTVGAAACGMARRALDEALFRATTREQFGKTIAENQLIQGHLAHMATELDAARLLVYRAAFGRDKGTERVSIDASMAKWYATEAAQRVIDLAVQIHGGAGVLRGIAVERLYRDVRALRIYEGTSEVHQIIIARVLTGGERARQEARIPGDAGDSLRQTAIDRPHSDTSKTVETPAMLAPPSKPATRPTPKRPLVAQRTAEEAMRKTMPEIPAQKRPLGRETMPDTPATKLLGKASRRGEPDDNDPGASSDGSKN
ncbi:MAG: acyl-CoA dehydrogenase family protein [Myxococcales bacterium]|nr:acyl-CoA dehydrogenase family protein [Myxococcales bacterium]